MKSLIVELPFAAALPLAKAPLVQCITNEITCESMANALLYLDAKPVMADDPREFAEFFQQNDSLLLNLGHISAVREKALLQAGQMAQATQTPTVVDLVGVAATKLRRELGRRLEANRPAVIKGNMSELRAFCGLANQGRGVDSSGADQNTAALQELAATLQMRAQATGITYLATGEKDLVVTADQAVLLENGVAMLDRFTGTGDIVGALIAALLGTGIESFAAVVIAVSYFNICGERAVQSGLADFRQETLNQISLLLQEKDWYQNVEGDYL